MEVRSSQERPAEPTGARLVECSECRVAQVHHSSLLGFTELICAVRDFRGLRLAVV